MADDDSSELSSLSSLSPAPSEDESDIQLKSEQGILKFFHRVAQGAAAMGNREKSPPVAKRPPSPPHELVLADNQDIAVSRPRGRVAWMRSRRDANGRVMPQGNSERANPNVHLSSSLSCSETALATPFPEPWPILVRRNLSETSLRPSRESALSTSSVLS